MQFIVKEKLGTKLFSVISDYLKYFLKNQNNYGIFIIGKLQSQRLEN